MQRTVYFAISCSLICFVVLRAIYVPLVHDEIATFYYYIQSFEFNPFSGAHADANNHILNSLLSSVSYNLFGYSNFSLRLPNVLSFLLYLVAIWKISKHFSHAFLRWMYVVASLGMLYFIQFFSLSRGYGISMAFLMFAIYALLELYTRTSLKHSIYFSVGILLAISANLTLLPLGLLLYTVAVFLTTLNRNTVSLPFKFRLKTIIIHFITALIIAVFVFLSFQMKAEGSLYYGNANGFWLNTVLSLLELLFESSSQLVQISFLILFSFFLFLTVLLLVKKGTLFFTHKQGLFSISLFGTLIGVYLLHIVLDVNYPVDRVGLYFVPFFVGALFFTIDQFDSPFKYFGFIALILPIHFCLNLNVNYTSLWKKEYIPDSFYEYIAKAESETKYPATIAGDALRMFNYNEKVYRNNAEVNALQFWTRDKFNTENWTINTKEHPAKYFDFIIAEPKWMHTLNSLYDSIAEAPRSKHVLYERKKTPELQIIAKNKLKQDTEQAKEFNELIKYQIDSLGSSTVLVGIDLAMQSLSHPFKGRIVAQAKNLETDDIIAYEYIQLNWIEAKTVKSKPILKTMLLRDLPTDSNVELLVYIWNMKTKRYTLYTSEVELFTIRDKNH